MPHIPKSLNNSSAVSNRLPPPLFNSSIAARVTAFGTCIGSGGCPSTTICINKRTPSETDNPMPSNTSAARALVLLSIRTCTVALAAVQETSLGYAGGKPNPLNPPYQGDFPLNSPLIRGARGVKNDERWVSCTVSLARMVVTTSYKMSIRKSFTTQINCCFHR